MRRALSIAVLLPLLISPVVAQQPARTACTGVDHRQFDFWVGDWEVTDSAGTTVYGTNHVNREEGGCLVHENWTGSRGGTGTEPQFFQPGKGAVGTGVGRQ